MKINQITDDNGQPSKIQRISPFDNLGKTIV